VINSDARYYSVPSSNNSVSNEDKFNPIDVYDYIKVQLGAGDVNRRLNWVFYLLKCEVKELKRYDFERV
jgi:hypothetical protein